MPETSSDISPDRIRPILDLAGNRPLGVLRKAPAPCGTLVLGGGEGGDSLFGGLGRTLRAALWSMVLKQRLAMLVGFVKPEPLQALGRSKKDFSRVGGQQVQPHVDDGAARAVEVDAEDAVVFEAHLEPFDRCVRQRLAGGMRWSSDRPARSSCDSSHTTCAACSAIRFWSNGGDSTARRAFVDRVNGHDLARWLS